MSADGALATEAPLTVHLQHKKENENWIWETTERMTQWLTRKAFWGFLVGAEITGEQNRVNRKPTQHL